MSRLKKYIKKSVPKKQLGGLISSIGGGLTGTLFGQGLPNDNYNYQNTGHRSTSYDGLQYIPQADEPNLMPQMLDAYNTKFKLKNLYDPEKHKLDTGDFEKNLKTYQIDEDNWRTQKQLANNQIDTYIKEHRYDPEKMAELPMYIQKIKDNLMMGVRGMINDYDQNQNVAIAGYKAKDIYNSTHQYQFGANDYAYKRIVEVRDKRTGEKKQVPMVQSESQIYAEQGNLKGWQPAGVTDLEQSFEYFQPNSAFGYGKKMRLNTSTPEQAMEDLQKFYADKGFKQKADAVANSVRGSNIGGFDADLVVWNNTSNKWTNKENIDNIKASSKQFLEVLPTRALEGFTRAFNSKPTVILEELDDKGNPVTEIKEVKVNRFNEKKGRNEDVIEEQKSVKLVKKNMEDLTQAEKQNALSFFIAQQVINRENVNKQEEETNDASSSVTLGKVEHNAGTNAENERRRREMENNLIYMEEERDVRDAKGTFGEVLGGELEKILEGGAYALPFIDEGSVSTGESLSNDTFASGAIERGTYTAVDGKQIVIKDSQGNIIPSDSVEDRLNRSNQKMGQTIQYYFDGKPISKEQAIGLKRTGHDVKEKKEVLLQVYGVDYKSKDSKINKEGVDISSLPTSKKITPKTEEYFEIARNEMLKAEKEGRSKSELLSMRKAFEEGKVEVRVAIIKGKSTNKNVKSVQGTFKNPAKGQGARTLETPSGKKEQFGGKLQQGGIIPEEYFNKIELPNLNLDDLY